MDCHAVEQLADHAAPLDDVDAVRIARRAGDRDRRGERADLHQRGRVGRRSAGKPGEEPPRAVRRITPASYPPRAPSHDAGAAVLVEPRVERLDRREDLVGDRLLLVARRAGICSKRNGSPYWTVTFGNCSRFQLRTLDEPWIATGTIVAPDSSARRPMPGLAPRRACRCATAALAVHRDAAAVGEDVSAVMNASSSRAPRRTGNTPPWV